jgi:uncharacterized protein (DUF58 family)
MQIRPTKTAVWLTGGGIAIAILPVLSSSSTWPLWPLFVCVIVFLLALEFMLSVKPGQVQWNVSIPATIPIGEHAQAEVAMEFPSGRKTPYSVALDVSDLALPPQIHYDDGSDPVSTIQIPVQPKRRGLMVLETLRVRYPGRLGLLEWIVARPVQKKSSVVPNTVPVRKAAIQFADRRTFRSGLKIERYRGDGTEFESLREFIPGDEIRSINWKSSAKHRTLLARQYRAERNHQIVFAIDTGHLMSEPIGNGVPKLDHAVTTTLLMSYVSLKAGDRVGLYTFDAKVGHYLPPKGGVQFHKVLTDFSGKIDYSDSETNFTLGLSNLLQKLRRRSLVVVLTDFVDTVTAELMVQNLGRLSRKHVVMFVSLRDPDLAKVALAEPDDLFSMNRSVVAGTLLRTRENVIRELRLHGIHPLDLPPEEIGPQAISRYLEIKRRELI